MEDIVEIKNLTFGYNDERKVLTNLSLNIKKGNYTVILGKNGSGKSTLAKILLGLLEKDEGSIIIDGLELNEKNIYKIREKVGIVFQNPDNQFIGATVADDIAFGLENHLVPHDDMQGIIEDFATKVDMIDFLDKEPSRLSGGQKQRVAIAGVLAMHPDILIFDEATSMLDPKGKREIKELIYKTKHENQEITVISISHDIEECLLADEIVVLHQGEIYLQDSPLNIFKDYEKMKEIGLDIPFINKVILSLKNKGIDVSSATSMEELVKLLCQ